jgi:hypothetical protein
MGIPFIDSYGATALCHDWASHSNPAVRFQSPLFTIDTLLGDPFGPTRAVSDGYWVALTGLPPGTHTLRFGGTAQPTDIYAEYEPLSQELTYTITVIPEPASVVVIGLLAVGGLGVFRRRMLSLSV